MPDLAIGAYQQVEKAHNLLSPAFMPAPEGQLDAPSTSAATKPTEEPTAEKYQGMPLRRSSRPPRPTAAAVALANAHDDIPQPSVPPAQQPQQPAAAGPTAVCNNLATDAGSEGFERVLMWVRPMAQRSGEHMMFEMAPAQPLAPGSWARLLNPGSWYDASVTCLTG